MSALVRCPKCPKEIAYPWPFADVDLYCPLCGAQTIGLRANQGAIFSDSGLGEVWAYLDAGSDNFEIALELERARVGARRDSAPGTKPIPLVDFIEWERAGGTIREANGNTVHLSIKWNAGTGRAAITPERRLITERSPAKGLFGELFLPGLNPESFSFRLWSRPTVPLRIDPVSDADQSTELTAYLDQSTQTAFVVLTLNSSSVPVAVDSVVLLPEARETIRRICRSVSMSTDHPERKPTHRPILWPGQPETFKFQFKECSGTLDRVPFDLSFHLRGIPDPVHYPARLSLRQKPSIMIFSSGAMAQEDISVNLGGRPKVFDLYLLESSSEETASAHPDPTGAIRIEPGEHAAWLKPMQRLDDRISSDAKRPTRLRMKINTLGISRAADHMAGKNHDVAVVIRDRGGFDLARYPLRVRFDRMPQMSDALAFDWGTTNNCAAIGGVGFVHPVALDPTRPEEFERFSSALYVKSVESEDSPELAVGIEAQELIPVSANPECVLRGLKRLFLAGNPVRLRDPDGRQRDYPVEVIAAEYLRRMIDALEQLLDKEIGIFGLTYPTKWPANVRDRLARTIETVRAAVGEGRPERRIDIMPPRLDEATACALSALRALWSQPASGETGGIDLEKGAVVIAYDFGGGTVDTVVLDVVLTPADELQTRLIGVGGRPDFGGDDITRCIVRILCERISRYLKSQLQTHEFRILFANEADRDSFPLTWNLEARQNAERLWVFAESIKRDLCQPSRDATISPVVAAFGELGLNSLAVFPNSLDEPPQSLGYRLREVTEGETDLRAELLKVLHFELVTLYDTSLDGTPGITIRDHLMESFEQLRAQLTDVPDDRNRLVVLAGGGCRLPLIQELARSYLLRGTDRLDFQEGFAKQRVAHGKAWELAFCLTGDQAMLQYTPPGDVSHRALLSMRQSPRGEKSELLVPAGAKMDDASVWHAFQISMDSRRSGTFNLFTREWIEGKWQSVKIGEFDKSAIPSQSGAESLWAEPWPIDIIGTVDAGICLLRDAAREQQIWLRIQRPATADWLGPYHLIPTGSWGNVARILQGYVEVGSSPKG